MRLQQRPIDERPSVREDDPSQEHPELCISCPGLSLHTKMPTVDRDLKRHREQEGEREMLKEGSDNSNNLENVRQCYIKKRDADI